MLAAKFHRQNLPPPKNRERRLSAGLGTYELIMTAAASAGRDDAVLAQADAARAALRDSDSSALASEGGDGDIDTSSSGGGSSIARRGEISPAALAIEAAAAGRLRQWDRVSPLVAKAMRPLRGSAGARLYAALIAAAAACGKPERGLEIFREMASGDGDSDADGGLSGRRRLPPPDGATFMAALDACAAVGGERSVELAIAVTKHAAAAAREFRDNGGGAGGGSEELGSSLPDPSSSTKSPAAARKPALSSRRLAAVLARAGEVCSPFAATTAEALKRKSLELGGGGETEGEGEGSAGVVGFAGSESLPKDGDDGGEEKDGGDDAKAAARGGEAVETAVGDGVVQ